MKTRIHISLEVKNLQRSVEFYSRVFNEKPTRLKDDYANFRLEEPQLHLALNVNDSAKPILTSQHFGVELFSEQELTDWLSKVQASGIAAETEEGTTCCYAVADKFWLTDPDNHKWEFWHRKYDVDHASDGTASTGCVSSGRKCC